MFVQQQLNPQKTTDAIVLAELKQGIDQNCKETLYACIDNHPFLLLEAMEGFSSSLHYALFQKANAQIIIIIATQLNGMGKLLELADTRDANGDTLLHQCVLTGSYSILNFFSTLLDSVMNELARVCNYVGDLPYDLIDKRKSLSLEAKDKMKALLAPATFYNPLKKFDVKIDEAVVMQDFSIKKPTTEDDVVYNENLKIACEIINMTKVAIQEVGNHCESNALSDEEFLASIKRMDVMKGRSKQVNLTEEFSDVILDIEKYRRGYCDECAAYALHLLMKYHPGKLGVIALVPGHIVMVIDPVEMLNSHFAFSRRSVICDAWGNYAGPGDEATLSKVFFSWKSIAKTHSARMMNAIVKFNPVFHQFNFFVIDIYHSFFMAAYRGNLAALCFLIDNYKLAINHVSINKCTALMHAAENFQEHIVKELLSRGANPEILNAHGFGIVHMMARCGSIALIKLLKKHNVDFTFVDAQGYSAVSHALDQGRFALAKYILSFVPQNKLTKNDYSFMKKHKMNQSMQQRDFFFSSSMAFFSKTISEPEPKKAILQVTPSQESCLRKTP